MSSSKLPVLSLIVCNLFGALFATGWWLVIASVFVNYYTTGAAHFSGFMILLPLMTTASMALLGGASRRAISSDNFWGGGNSSAEKGFLFVMLAVMMSGPGICLTLYFVYHQDEALYGNALLLPIGCGIIALSGIIVKFARPMSDEFF